MSTSWPQTTEQLHRLIRDGRLSEAQKFLKKLSRGAIPREWVRDAASLARRAGLPELGIHWLNPFVRPSGRTPRDASPEETVEYGACLTRIGLSEEALSLLRTVDGRDCPRVLFERAAAYVACWDYAESIPLLREYLATRKLASYDRLVAKVNLAAAYVHESEERKATPLLRELLHDTSLRRLPLLLGTALQFSAILQLSRRRFAEARQMLDRAGKVLSDASSRDAFFVRKWRVIVDLVEAEGDAAALERVAIEGAALRLWETPRDCDRALAVHARSTKHLWRAYFGTPYPKFRARLLEDRPGRIVPPDHYLWQPGEAGEVTATLDLQSHALSAASRARETAGGPRASLLALSSDFYRPFRVPTLFQLLHPDEFYHPEASPARIRQALHALRTWLKTHAPGVSVVESAGDYRLHTARGWAIRVPRQNTGVAPERERRLLAELEQAFGAAEFTSRQAAEHIGLSQRGALRILTWGIEHGTLLKGGKRAAAHYRFK